MPHIARGCVRVEVACPSCTTGITRLPRGVELGVPQLITATVFEHEAKSEGGGATTQAHAQGDERVRAWTEQTWRAMRAEMARGYAEGKRS